MHLYQVTYTTPDNVTKLVTIAATNFDEALTKMRARVPGIVFRAVIYLSEFVS
jgi:hypothetical protein